MALVYQDKIAPGTILLGADTIVVGPGRTLGKPRDAEDALNMLALLRGNPHYVVTGFVLTAGNKWRALHIAPRSCHLNCIYARLQ